MEEFTVDKLDLSMLSPEDGTRLQANVYHVEGIYDIDGSPRDLSIGQLVMAICLDRATELERKIVNKIGSNANVTGDLEALTAIQARLVEKGSLDWSGDPIEFDYYDKTGTVLIDHFVIDSWSSALSFFQHEQVKIDIDGETTYDDAVSGLTSAMNSLNSVSQTDMIELQSLTSKRDQSYTLITNVLKSLYSVNLGNVNNY